jgi:deazaflavin-dependent oxidoreductase (nitroreductase family)
MAADGQDVNGAGRAGVRSFPRPTTNLYKLIFDDQYRKAFRSRLKTGNRFMGPLYSMRLLPLFGLGNQIMLLSTRGRKSGQMRDTPIGYFIIDGQIYVFSGWGRDANWYKNIQACPDDVYLQVGFHRFPARAEEVADLEARRRILQGLVEQDPHGAQVLMGWDPKADCLEAADFSLMLEKVVVIRFSRRS